ncbi:MAG: enoyl-CoA hydratase-related protein [Sandaracinaceae bacterium]
MANDRLVLVEHEGPITVLTVNRPDKLNALSPAVLEDLQRGILDVSGRRETRCVILTGTGDKAFVAGADIAAMRGFDVEAARTFAHQGHQILHGLETLEPPVIAAVNGFALGGGCELALACDFIHASEKARFGQPEVKLGVIPGFGGTQRLARRVGVGLARELVYSGATIDAGRAHDIGLVNAVHPHDQLMAKVRELAATIAEMGPRAVARAKRIIREGEEQPLMDANHLEAEAFAECFGTPEQAEGMDAFLAKRDAAFADR